MKINYKKYLKTIFQMIIGIILVFSSCVNIYALSAENVDLNRSGSISIQLEYSGEKIVEGSFELYKVATIQNDGSGNLKYVFSEEFKEFDTSAIESMNSADKLEDYTKEKGISGTVKNMDLEGKITYDNLELGIYLVVQTIPATGYYPIKSFIVTVPEKIDEQVIYDVEALPKMVITKEDETDDGMSHTEIVQPPTDTVKDSGDKLIPQTGFLMAPIVIIFVVGVLLLMPGYITKKKDEDSENSEE